MPIGSPLQTLRPNQTLDCTLSLHSRESVLIYLFKQQLSLSLAISATYFLHTLPPTATPILPFLQPSSRPAIVPPPITQDPLRLIADRG